MTDNGHSSGSQGSDEDVVADGTGVEASGRHAAVATDSRTNERLVRAVGTYVVLGLGFVFTLFLAGQFAGGGGGSLIGTSGANAGYTLAVLLSPLIAVFVGTEIGKDGGGDAVVDAGIASAVGFVVMFFVTLVLAASLGSGGTSGAQAGPLIGLAIGVAITGSASAAAARWEQGFLDGVANPSLVKSIVFGSLAYLVFTIGFVIAVVLAGALSSGSGGGLGSIGADAFGASLVGAGVVFAPILALLLGLFAGRDGLDTPGQAAISGAVGAAVGSLLMVVGLLVAYAILQPTGGSIPIPVGPIVGIVVGAGLTGAGAGYVGGR